jgi:DNA-binding response OmpR family regulator
MVTLTVTGGRPGLELMGRSSHAGGASRDRPVRRGEDLVAIEVLVVEDDPIHAETIAETLERRGYVICGVVSSSDDAEPIALARRPKVIITDLRLLGPKSGIDIATSLRKHYDFGLIFVTGLAGSPLLRTRMRALKPTAILGKPIDPSDLLAAVDRAAQGITSET